MKKKLKFLVVEDEFISRTLLMEMLSPHGNCQTVINGKDAVEKIIPTLREPEKRFDLVCLDIMMPEMDGHQVLREVRHQERKMGLGAADTTKIMMVTALDDAQNMMEALVVGKCQAYITKPVSMNMLEDHLRHLHLINNNEH